VPVRIVPHDPLAQPDDALRSERVPKHALERGAVARASIRASIRVEQAGFGGDHDPGAVALDASGLEHDARDIARQPEHLGHRARDLGVPVPRRIFPAPGIEFEIDHGEGGCVGRGSGPRHHEQRPVIAHPRVVRLDRVEVDGSLELRVALADEPEHPVAHLAARHVDGDALARRDGRDHVDERGLDRFESGGPCIGGVGPREPGRLVGLPLGGPAIAVGAGRARRRRRAGASRAARDPGSARGP
jgi:hypothetical protein